MNIYKRFEWRLNIPGQTPHYIIATDRVQAEAKANKIAVKKGIVSYTLVHNPECPFSGRFRSRGKAYLRQLGTKNAALALARLRALKAQIDAGRFKEADTAKARQARQSTLANLFACYRRAARGLASIDQNINAMRSILRRVYRSDDNKKMDRLLLSIINGQLVRTWRQRILDQIEAENASDTRAQQIKRSANSILRQARSLFASDLPATYRDEGLTIPEHAVLGEFLDAAGFDNTGKTDYNAPADHVITATFHALDKMHASLVADTPTSQRSDTRNLYLAVWLALGFGLRRSEVAQCRNSWFIKRDAIVYCRGDVLAKDGAMPDVRAQLGVWDKIAPLLCPPDDNAKAVAQALQTAFAAETRPDQKAVLKVQIRNLLDPYVLCGTYTERTETVFRRVSEWMERLGWHTQKKEHELRAYAASKIAEANGLMAAQAFLRHKSYATTEKFYLRYLRIKQKEVKLELPSEPAVNSTAVVIIASESHRTFVES